MNYIILSIIIIVLLITMLILNSNYYRSFYKYDLINNNISNISNKEGFEPNPFVNEQDKYYEGRVRDRLTGIYVPGQEEAEKYIKYDPSKPEGDRLISPIYEEQQRQMDSNVDNEVLTCKNITSCEQLNGTNCGYCFYNDTFYYGNQDGPFTDTCQGGWVKTKEQCNERKEKAICSKVKSCTAMTGEASICGWCPTRNRAFPARKENGKLVPKYSSDKCSGTNGELISKDQCSSFEKDNPCINPNMSTGPHSRACLEKMWSEVGCSPNGTGSPQKNRNNVNWWNRRGYDSVLKDMKLYKKYADSKDYNLAKRYYERCYGRKPNSCDTKYSPRPMECLNELFLKSGCTTQGDGFPERANRGQVNWWNTQSNSKVLSDMKAWNNYANSSNWNQKRKYYPLCYGGDAFKKLYGDGENINLEQGLNVYVYDLGSFRGTKGRKLIKNPIRVANLNQLWGRGEILNIRKDQLYLEVDGFIMYPTNANNIKFRIGSDDGSRLYLNGELVIDNWGLHGFRWRESSERKNTDGGESLKIEFYENYGGAGLRLQWSIDGGGWSDIDKKYLKSARIGEASTGVDYETLEYLITIDKGRYNLKKGNIDSILNEIRSRFPKFNARIGNENDLNYCVKVGKSICRCGYYKKGNDYVVGYPSTKGTSGGCGGGREKIISCGNPRSSSIWIVLKGRNDEIMDSMRALGYDIPSIFAIGN